MGCSVPWKGIPDFSWKSLHFLSDLKETPSDTFRRTMENRSNYTYRYRAPLPERESGAFCDWTKRAATRKKKRKKGRKGEEEGRSRKIPVALSSSFFRVVRPRKPGYRLILLIVLPRTRPRISWTGKFVYTVAQKYPDHLLLFDKVYLNWRPKMKSTTVLQKSNLHSHILCNEFLFETILAFACRIKHAFF